MKFIIVSNIFLSRQNPYIDKIIRDRQCGFRLNKSNIDQTFYIREILGKNWGYNETALTKACGSVLMKYCTIFS
jgi:hypothetical protein